jgi:hypothetical protein
MAQLLTRFLFWDDEGYMLVSLAHYFNEGNLYTKTFSQYGPFYFYAQAIFFHLLNLPVNHNMGRLVTLVYWVASSLLASVFVYRLFKSIFLASAAALCCALVGLVLTDEPGHPQQVVLLLYMVAACLSIPLLSDRYELRLFLLGCVGAALAFTKINLGVFYIAGLVHSLVCVLPSGRMRSIGIGLTLIYAAAFPWLLMHSGFDHGFRGYFVLATVGGFSTFACGALIRLHHYLPVHAALWAGAGLLSGTMLVVVATLLQGVSTDSLIWGMVLNPLNHPNVLYAPPPVGRFNLLAALILGAGLVGLRLSGLRLPESRWLDVLRCVAGIASISASVFAGPAIAVSADSGTWVQHWLLSLQYTNQWVVPLLPLTLIPQPHLEQNADATFSRLFITNMAVTQFLGPYPVAGSQVGIAAAPVILWAFLCIRDGIAGLRTALHSRSADPREGLRLDAVIGSAIVVGFAGLSIALFGRSQFPAGSTVLRGSGWLHLPPEQVIHFESVVRNVSTKCNTLFTMPGMGSFNMWSGVRTPNGWNLTSWMKGISSQRQAEILEIIKSDSQACAIVNRRIVRFWDRDEDEGYLAALPLARYVMTDMPKIAQFGDYEIHVQPASQGTDSRASRPLIPE